jgi:hypothetical protein
LPFVYAIDRNTSNLVAVRHYERLKERLENAHLPATAYNIALAWNGGIGAVISGRAPRVARDYAQRAANLAGLFQRNAAVADSR